MENHTARQGRFSKITLQANGEKPEGKTTHACNTNANRIGTAQEKL